jgi:hypothetical protein
VNTTNKGEQAIQCLIQLNQANLEDYQKLLTERVGPEVLAIFERYCSELFPEESNEEVLSALTHLMITGYLVSANEQQAIGSASPLIKLEE